MEGLNNGDTVEVDVEYRDGNTKSWVGRYEGVEQRDYGKTHVVFNFKTESVVDIPVDSEVESVKPYSVI